jgi:hypothetical protein
MYVSTFRFTEESTMQLGYIQPVWRAAALRGVCLDATGCEALVSFGEQYLRLPIAAARAELLRSSVGRRVWVDVEHRALRVDGPGDCDVQ